MAVSPQRKSESHKTKRLRSPTSSLSQAGHLRTETEVTVLPFPQTQSFGVPHILQAAL